MDLDEAMSQGMTPAMFRMIDADSSGNIGEAEFVDFQRATTIAPDTVASSAVRTVFSMAYLEGAEHTATVHSSIAGVLYKRRDYDAALARYETCLAIREQAFGAGHPSVASTQTDIAATCTRIGGAKYTEAHTAGGDFDAAMGLFERALARNSDPACPSLARALSLSLPPSLPKMSPRPESMPTRPGTVTCFSLHVCQIPAAPHRLTR